MQGILFAAHWFLYKTIVRFFGITNPSHMMGLKISLIALSLSFIASSIVAFRFYNVFSRILYTVGSVWLGAFYFFMLACILTWVIFGITHSVSRLIPSIIFLIAVGLTIYSVVNACNPRVHAISVKIPNLPDSWKNKTAVWASDIHLGQIHGVGFSQRVVDMINDQHPDIVFIGGDLYDGVAVDIPKVTKPFSTLTPPLGTYFITGNHEEFDGNEKYLQAVKDVGMIDFDNKIKLVDGVQLIGVDYHDATNKDTYKQILDNMHLDLTKSTILLKHTPDKLDIAQKAGVSFQISGHTHDGQIFPMNYITSLIYKGFESGLKTFNTMQVYTSNGTGTWGPPLRFGNTPEIVTIRFE